MDWITALAWMIVIFIFSTDYFSSEHMTGLVGPVFLNFFPEVSTVRVETLELLIRKLAHWSEYFVLALLLMRAVRTEFSKYQTDCLVVWSVGFIVIYAISDEWHQSFVPSRTTSATDVLIDTIGVICGTLCYLRNRRMATA